MKNKTFLLEKIDDKNIKRARKYYYQLTNNDSFEEWQENFEYIRGDVPNVRLCNYKYLYGTVRMYCGGQIFNNKKRSEILNRIIYFIVSQNLEDKFDANFNGLWLGDLEEQFDEAMQNYSKQQKNNSYSKAFMPKNTNYQIVRINSFNEAQKYYKYCGWCIAEHQETFDSYTDNGNCVFYFCLKQDFQKVPREKGANCPFDEYGLSMIAICVEPNGDLKSCTLRWNHDIGGNDKMMNKDEIEDFFGTNFYETFKPFSDADYEQNGTITVTKVKQMLADNVDYTKIFDRIYLTEISDSKYQNLKIVELHEKYSFIYQNSQTQKMELIHDGNLWFDEIVNYYYYFGVKYKGKWTFIDTNCHFVKNGKFWLDSIDSIDGFKDGLLAVRLNSKYTFLNKKLNFINNGELWFDNVRSFVNGLAAVKFNGKWTFINTKGQLINNGGLWFDSISMFNGVFKIKYNNTIYFIDKNYNFYDSHYNPIQPLFSVVNESVVNLNKIITEAIAKYLQNNLLR